MGERTASEQPLSPGRGFVYLVLFFAVAAISLAAPMIRLAQSPSLAIAFLRLAFSTALLAPFALAREGRRMAVLPKREMLLLALSGLFLALHFATWISSLALTSVASSVVIVATQPIFAALFGFLFLKERMPWLSVLGLVLAIAGSAVIGAGDFSGGGKPLLGDLLSLSGAVFVAGYLLIGRSLRKSLPILAYIFPVYLFAALFLGLICLFTRTPLGPFPGTAYLWIFLLALVPQTMGHSLYNWALRHVKAYMVGVAVLGEPIGAALLAVFLFKEIPGPASYLGAGLILVGVFLALYKERGG
jgi:drug/metabolite transporter (DMT)-like permease